MDAETERLVQAARGLNALDCEAEREFAAFAEDFSTSYFRMRKVADRYLSVAGKLSSRMEEALNATPDTHTPQWEEFNLRAAEYQHHGTALHKALEACVVQVFKCLSGVDGLNRRVLLTGTTALLASFRELVDYRDSTRHTILSDWSRYPEIWKGTNDILALEMGGKFAYLHRQRLELIPRLRESGCRDGDLQALKTLCLQYSVIFQQYARTAVGSFAYECCLVNHYTKYLESVLSLGRPVYKTVAESDGRKLEDLPEPHRAACARTSR